MKFLLFFLFLSINCYSQNINVYYQYVALYDMANDKNVFQSEPLVLSIEPENGKSVFRSLYKSQRDSIINSVKDKSFSALSELAMKLPKPSYQFVYFKNPHSILIQDDVNTKIYIYPRKYPKNEWTLGKESKIIGGYKCQNAFLDFGGRTWEAWYALDLPLNNGPMNFRGLPGIILEMYDTQKHHAFNFLGIDFNKQLYVEQNADVVKLNSIDQFRKIRKNAKYNMIAEWEALGVVYSPEAKRKINDQQRTEEKNRNPLELVPED